MVPEENEPVPAVFVVERDTSGHLVNVRFRVELINSLVGNKVWHGITAYLVALDVVKPITISKILGNGTLAASCWASDDEDMVVVGNRHFSCLYSA